jgi:hypothetical protein
VFSAAGETGNRATNPSDAQEFLFAVWADVHKSRRKLFRREGQIVTTRFVRDSQIAARLSPFRSMRRDSASASAPLREQMRQLVSQRALDLVINDRTSLTSLWDAPRSPR